MTAPWPSTGKDGDHRGITVPSWKPECPREFVVEVKRSVFERINLDRQRHGLAPVLYDKRAAVVGDAHCREMMENSYLSHWNLQGYKPYHRYSFAGGTDSIYENVSCVDATGDIHHTVADVVAHAIGNHEAMMAERPPEDGHRRTILDPSHTHVGVGIAFHRRGLRMAQEFVQRYVELSALPPGRVSLDQTLSLRGRLLDPSCQLSNIAIFYEPFPAPMSVQELKDTREYGLPPEVEYEFPRLDRGWHYPNNTTGSIRADSDGHFECPVRFKGRRPGLYTLCVWLKDSRGRSISATFVTVPVVG